MSKTGGPAFPNQYAPTYPERIGMTLLDYFAGQALAAIVHEFQDPDNGSEGWSEWIAGCAYDVAEAMLAEKAKREASRGC